MNYDVDLLSIYKSSLNEKPTIIVSWFVNNPFNVKSRVLDVERLIKSTIKVSDSLDSYIIVGPLKEFLLRFILILFFHSVSTPINCYPSRAES